MQLCNADRVISTWAEKDWADFAAARAQGTKAEWQPALQRFLLGVAYRMDELQAHEMAELLETTDLPDEARAELVDHVEFSLGLLAAYERLVGDDDHEEPEMTDDAHSVGPGDLVI